MTNRYEFRGTMSNDWQGKKEVELMKRICEDWQILEIVDSK